MGVKGVSETGPSRFHRRFVWVFALTIAFSSAGCLFPPVSTPVTVEGTGQDVSSGNPGNDTPVYRQQIFQQTQAGTMDAAFQIQGTNYGDQQHAFDLPERLDVVRVFLEWNHTVYDLDLYASLIEDPNDGPVWQDSNTEGGLGEPDNPAVVEVSDRSKIFFESPTQLRVTVLAEAGADIPYTLTVRATYLIPV